MCTYQANAAKPSDHPAGFLPTGLPIPTSLSADAGSPVRFSVVPRRRSLCLPPLCRTTAGRTSPGRRCRNGVCWGRRAGISRPRHHIPVRRGLSNGNVYFVRPATFSANSSINSGTASFNRSYRTSELLIGVSPPLSGADRQ